MKKGDLIIGLIVLIVMAALGIGYKLYTNSLGTDRFVVIKIDNQEKYKIKLTPDVDQTIEIKTNYGYNLVHIYNNGVKVVEADCPNQDDVKQGFVTMPGFPIVCVPHHLYIVITGAENESSNDGFSE